jgi:hypothetical protein
MSGKRDKRQIDNGKPKPPLALGELFKIVLSGHLGVRKREHRMDDFGRANGLHVFIAAVIYFALVVTALVVLVSYIAR